MTVLLACPLEAHRAVLSAFRGTAAIISARRRKVFYRARQTRMRAV
jgi:hypothetical protein